MARALEGYINKKNNVVITMLTNTRVKYMLVIVLKKIYGLLAAAIQSLQVRDENESVKSLLCTVCPFKIGGLFSLPLSRSECSRRQNSRFFSLDGNRNGYLFLGNLHSSKLPAGNLSNFHGFLDPTFYG